MRDVIRREMTRRAVTAGLAALPLFGAAGARAASAARVVIVGGGAGGATAAVTLKRAVPLLEVTLIEPEQDYTSCFHSNHYLGGFVPVERITHGYGGLSALGITLVRDRAVGFDFSNREVRTEGGASIGYDRLVVAPGIGFKKDEIEGYDDAAREVMPHAWSGGVQVRALRSQIEAMEDGGLVVIAPPRNPYRCPPGPYERACLIAHHLKLTKPKSKVIVIDPKMAYSKQAVFEEGIAKYYKGILEVHLTNDLDDMALQRVDGLTGELVTKSGDVFKSAVANVIPDQTAGKIALDAGLTDKSGWCPVEFATFRSTLAEHVYVVGDAAVAADMPKSAYSASDQARTVAGHILADLTGTPRPPAVYRNTCWSMLAPDDSVWIGADYAPGEFRGRPVLVPRDSFISAPGEPASVRKATYDGGIAWYRTLTDEMFAKAGVRN
ncbi:Flavocytochrome C sulfide dehydrogenase flavin-binding protein [Hyphomicrobium nitrativorans NL23]|uniref:Flavocytochrome C sulfide dehydrogenase flavin-binding protein n=1 Tax=Hyphomicrobium nitrativorans NL23 TaxID=1029756 RepID=V5SEH7_9HYPH|nr:NAD(P)/FAD-dependent oxidoreductase [Hyphomicrobium nitrativorans]AHB48897.1 Flavocytochrome C sulfide dehydrogenase flavin-binding protein [Hyphomicrobium nitrativorans NL23]